MTNCVHLDTFHDDSGHLDEAYCRLGKDGCRGCRDFTREEEDFSIDWSRLLNTIVEDDAPF